MSITHWLCFICCKVAFTDCTSDPRASAIVGLIVVGGTFLGFALTGAAMNPARALGPAWAGDVWGDHWIYWIGPLAGAAMAAFVYEGFYVGRLLPGKDQ